MSATKALQLWCKQQCEGYKGVSITNMTTSFRDGLAFCAILHRHRPDLINFSSLHKENVYENNQLAFKVAERELGIPALLDAEDMVALKVPDRLSILTYVSQYYNYFHGRSPIGGMAGVKRSPSISSEEPAGKKVVPEPVSPSPPKPSLVHVPSEPKTNPALKGKENAPVEAKRRVLAENANLRSSNCAICGDHVHLVQRLLMDGKLYHRNCFRCKQCSNTLKSGNYKVGNDPGTFICNQHEEPTHLQNSLHVNTRNVLGENKPARPPSTPWLKEVESKKPEQESQKPSHAPQSSDAAKAPVWEHSNFEHHKSVSVAANPGSRWSEMNKGNKLGRCENTTTSPFSSNWTPSSAKTQQAREKFFQASPLTVDKTEPVKSRGTPLNPSPLTVDKTEPVKSRGTPLNPSPLTVDKTEPVKSRGTPLNPSPLTVDKTEPIKSQNTPLNPSQVTGRTSFPGPGSNANSNEKDRARNILLNALPTPQSSTNKPASLGTTSGKPTPAPSGLQHLETRNLPTGEISRPAGVLSAMEKPRRDPLGTPHGVESLVQDPGNRPGIRTATQIQVKVANGQSANAGHKVDIKVTEGVSATEEKAENPADWRSRLKPVANKFPSQGEAKIAPKPTEVHKTVINIALKPTQDDRKPVPSPAVQDIVPPSDPTPKKKLLVARVDVSSGWQKAKQQWEDPSAKQTLEVPSIPKRAIAPVRPSSPRTFQKHPSKLVVSPSKLHPDYIPEEEIQREVRRIEKDLDRLELKGVDLEKQLRGCEGDDTEDALMVEWFKLIHEKQLLLRRESELMHKMNQQKLEEKQWDIETELRTLMSKSDSLKTPREKTREEELLKLYLETVDDRNKIVEDLDEDRLRELEEDEVLAAMIQKLDGPRSTPESEKKKTKFGFFKILKTKT